MIRAAIIALTAAQAAEFEAFEAAHPEVKIGVCLQNRMNETTEELKKIIDSGEYGKIVGIRGFVPWRRGPEYYSVKPWRGTWKYAGSVRLLHLKDYKIANVEMPDMRGADGMAKFVSAFFDKPVRFAELGAGSLPLKACIEAGIEGGAEYFLIDQDDSYGRDPFDCLKDSRAHLVELGYESWF